MAGKRSTHTATLTRIAADIAPGQPDLRHRCGAAGHVESVVKAVRRRHTPRLDLEPILDVLLPERIRTAAWRSGIPRTASVVLSAPRNAPTG